MNNGAPQPLFAWFFHHPKTSLWAVAALCLLPFIQRPVFVDDHAHFQQAIERGRNLSVLYSNAEHGLGWRKGESPTEANGPVYFFIMGLFTRIFGTAEWTSHIFVFLLTGFGLISFYDICRRYVLYPFWAACIWFSTPHLWITANSLLLDAFLAPFMLIGLVLFINGWEKNNFPLLTAGAVFLGLAPLVKYTGFLAVAVSILWIGLEKREFTNRKSLSLLIPFLILFGWMAMTSASYGESHLKAVFKSSVNIPSAFDMASLLAYLSGTSPFLLVLPFIMIMKRDFTALERSIPIICLILGVMTGAFFFPRNRWIGLQWGFWSGTGAAWIYGLIPLILKRKGNSLFLFWSFLGLFGLLIARRWLCARYFVIVSPALVIVTILWIQKMIPAVIHSSLFRGAALILFGVFSAAMAVSDQNSAAIDKRMAAELNKFSYPFPLHYPAATLSGLGYYLDPDIWKPIRNDERLNEGDAVLLPISTLPPRFYPQMDQGVILKKWEFYSWLPIRMLGGYSGFYGSIWGPLPVSVASAPRTIYLLVQNKNKENEK